jgi:hypothetical protein
LKGAQAEVKPLQVVNSVSGSADPLARHVNEALVVFVDMPPPRKITASEILTDPVARREYFEQKAAERNRDAALDRMGVALKSGKDLSVEDVRLLRREDLEAIKTNGDTHLRVLIRERQHEYGRER